jgi:L-ascorbate metabolism protein UlaG (beta-lactamase superfamily)
MAEEKPPEPRITYLGHASLLMEMDGMRLLTDPVFRQRIYHLRRTSPSPDAAAFRDVDAVLISHLHYDHLDIPTLQALGDAPLIYIPSGASALLERAGIHHYKEISLGETFNVRRVKVQAVPAYHTPSRRPLGLQADCLGFLLSGTATIYFPGDTQIFPEMADFSRDLDLALLPVWGWGPDKGKLHMGPKEAAEALTLLRPRLAVPIHWGTYIPLGMRWMRLGFQYLPPLDFSRRAQVTSPEVVVRILSQGENLSIPERPA